MDIALHPPLPTLRREVTRSLAVAGALVAALAAGVSLGLGLSPALPLASLAAFAFVAAYALSGLEGHRRPWGPANRVTLLRGGMASLLAGFLVAGPVTPAVAWALCVTAVIALALDGVDGWLARRRDVASPYGARFDMELDTLLTLVLALLLWRWGEAGPWVLLLGLLRHVFVLAGRAWPRLAAPLPFSQRRRVVCVVQVAVLAAGLAPVVEPPLTGLAAGAALALLIFSFAVDTVWLVRHGNPAADGPDHG